MIQVGENERCETGVNESWTQYGMGGFLGSSKGQLKFTIINLKCNQTACLGIFPLTFYVHAQSTVGFEKTEISPDKKSEGTDRWTKGFRV